MELQQTFTYSLSGLASAGFAQQARHTPSLSRARPAMSSAIAFAPVKGSSPPLEPLGPDEDVPPTTAVLVASWLVDGAPEVVVALPEVEVAPDVLVASEVVVGATVVVGAVVVVPGVSQPLTQKTLYGWGSRFKP